MGSQIDEFYKAIFGVVPLKAGAALERLAAIATYLMEGGEVSHDSRLKGFYSQTSYQLDVHSKTNNKSSMGEAKDYTIHNGKVGRGDLQKLGGALSDLKDVDEGIFFSATGYTRPAIKYAESATNMIGKPIKLYGLRESNDDDEKGFIKTIAITLHMEIPNLEKATWIPHLSDKGKEIFLEKFSNTQLNVKVEKFYDAKGNQMLSLSELTSHGYGSINIANDAKVNTGCFLLYNHFLDIENVLIEINGLEYNVPFDVVEHTFEITDNSERRLVLLDSNNVPIKILTDKELRKFSFDSNGKIDAQ